MATLTEVSFYTRRAVKYGLIGLFIILIAPVIWRGGKALYLRIRPAPPPPPTVAYGKLPFLQFGAGDDYKPSYKLETVNGTLPKLDKVGKVYVVEVNKSRLLELERVKTKAQGLGFTNEPEQVNDQTFKFIHPTNSSTLVVDVIYNTYKYQYPWTLDQALYSGRAVPSNDQAFLEAKAFWQALGLLASDLAEGKPQFAYFAAQPPQMLPVNSLSEANFTRVDLFRADLDKLPVVTTSGSHSPVNVIFSGISDRGKRVVEANYAYSKIVDGGFATYPLKTVDAAWNELQQGHGYIVKKAGSQVVVRKIYLAYYESDSPQRFIQPIYVFEGDGGFVAYVPAIDSGFVESAPVAPSGSSNTPSQ